MEEYKTTININLNGAGVQYHVKEDVECPHCKAGYLSLMRKCG